MKANGEVQTHDKAIVYVKELDIFLTMKVLDNTPAVLSFGKFCDVKWYFYEWINGQKPHLIKNRIRIICNTENFVLLWFQAYQVRPQDLHQLHRHLWNRKFCFIIFYNFIFFKPVVFWDPGVVARIQGNFGGWWNSITGRLSRQFFSWSSFGAHIQEKWGFG